MLCEASTSGPIQSVLFNEELNLWYLAGWREELELMEDGFKRFENREVVVQHVRSTDRLWTVTNDGMMNHSFLTE
jgi:hypothetical protein